MPALRPEKLNRYRPTLGCLPEVRQFATCERCESSAPLLHVPARDGTWHKLCALCEEIVHGRRGGAR